MWSCLRAKAPSPTLKNLSSSKRQTFGSVAESFLSKKKAVINVITIIRRALRLIALLKLLKVP